MRNDWYKNVLETIRRQEVFSGRLHIDGKTVETVSEFIFWVPKSLQMVIAAMKLKDAYSLEEKL